MAAWFYVSNGQQSGPVDEVHLRQLIATGAVGPDDLVWAEGMPQWVAVRAAPHLAAAPMAATPANAMAVGAPSGVEPMQLSYASPVDQAPVAIEHDEGPFMKIGGQFSVPGGKWTGMTIASPKAIYMLKGSKQASATAYHLGGVAGALIQQAFAKDDDVRTCAVGELPEPVRMMLDRKGKKAAKDAIVLPRGAINHVKVGSFNNVLTIRLDPDKFTLNRGLFSGKKIRRFLGENGWTLDQELAATAAPIHGRGLGRTFEEMEKRKPNSLKRVAMATFGMLLIIAIIISRVLAGR
jgi:hypothetical protein